MRKKIIIFTIILITGIIIGVNIKTTEVQNLKSENRNIEQMVMESFSLGCEVGMAIYCEPKNLMECKKKCFTFLNNNPKILDALKKKPEITIKKMESEKKKNKSLFF
jgi:hypothetical protein